MLSALFHAMSSRSAFCAGILIGLAGLTAAAAAQQTNQPAPANQPAQTNPPNQTQPATQAGQTDQGSAEGKKVIHDQAEYSAFIAASNTPDPKEQAEALESFAQHYPKSVVAADAMEEAMADWQKVGDSVKVLEIAKELLAVDKGNVRALAIVVALDRVSAAQGDSSALDELCLYSTLGMREISMWQKPAGVADADFAKLQKQMEMIFNGAAGYCAIEQRNFSQARDWFLRNYRLDPSNMQDIYQLAIANLEMTPIDADGFWYCAKAISIAKNSSNQDAVAAMETYCKPKYVLFHGNDQGWDSIMTMGAVQAEVPSEFGKAVSPASPAPQPAAPANPPHN
jgi:tetratricopeptide (TPR) repeat protein